MLDQAGPWREADGKFELNDDTIISMELWFRVLHNTVTEEMYSIPVAEVWHAIEVSRKYFLKLDLLKPWFNAWWSNLDKKNVDELACQELLYPCMELNHAIAFRLVTHMITYKWKGHITESNPTHHRHLHLRHHVIQQLNAAKGSLRGKIHRGLFDVIKEFLEATCTCKEKALFSYCIGLDDTGIWPLEEHGSRNSIETLLKGLDNFSYVPPADGCWNCKKCRESTVRHTHKEVRASFDGLCLDCMDVFSRASADPDYEYWSHNTHRKWSKSCRFDHGQPTWYFSYMGRKILMDVHNEKLRAERRKAAEEDSW